MRVLNERYQLLEKLGQGGMAEVYRARDLMLARYVAIKLLRADYSKNAAFQERFRQEARAAANLTHPNIVTVHDFGMDADQFFLVMEHVPGMDLKTMLKKRRHFSIEESVGLMIQACAGIGYAHRMGLVHCDVKPHNMLVTPDHRLKVTDFGIARALASIRDDERSDVVWGSPIYFSPEQAAGLPPSPASDVYSLGVVLYELISGQTPFQGSTAAELARQHRESEPPPIQELVPEVPDMLARIIHKVLAKEPAARYRTADQLGRVLMTFANNQRQETASPARPRPPAPHVAARPPKMQAAAEEPASQPRPSPAPSPYPEEPATEALDVDWVSIVLGLLALLAVGGLVPFWMWVYFVYNPPG